MSRRTSEQMRKHALSKAAAGYLIHPRPRHHTLPDSPTWRYDATDDPDVINGWFDADPFTRVAVISDRDLKTDEQDHVWNEPPYEGEDGPTFDDIVAAANKAQAEDRQARYHFAGDEPPPAPKQLIKRLLNEASVAIVGGQSGAGKTFLVIDMAVALAAGQGFFGHNVLEKVGVLFVAYEGAGMIHRRIRGACLTRWVCAKDVPIVWVEGVDDLNDKTALKNLAEDAAAISDEMVKRFGVKLGVIVIDTLGAAFGMSDENSNAEANQILRSLNALRRVTGCTIVPIAHYGKTESSGLRGASAWRGGADTILSVMADRDEVSGNVTNRRLALAKSRDDIEGPISGFELIDVSTGVDAEGGVTSAAIRPCVARQAGEPSLDPEKARRCVEALRGTVHRYHAQSAGWAGTIIAGVLGINLSLRGAKKNVAAILDGLVQDGVLERFTTLDAARKPKDFVRVAAGEAENDDQKKEEVA